MRNIIDKHSILITVATVVLNADKNILKTLLSITYQTYANIEFIVIDGGSSDSTVNILNEYSDKISYWTSEADNGIYDAMNKALKYANGDYLIFMNAGDTFFSQRTVEYFVNIIKDKDAVYYGNSIYFNQVSKTTKHMGCVFTRYGLSIRNICHQSIFYPHIVYKYYSYNLKYKLLSDWVYNMNIFSKFKFIYVDIDISYYDEMGISALNRDHVFETDQFYLIYKYLGASCFIYLFYNKIYNLFKQFYLNYKNT